MTSAFPTPQDLGLYCFPSFRPGQIPAIEEFINTDSRFLAQSMPTGFGKSGVCMADACLSGTSAVVLTSTKALQKQYLDDFESSGLVDVRGQVNYDCSLKQYADGSYMNCEDGGDHRCRARGDKTCTYLQAVQEAAQSRYVVTNYAYWVASGQSPEGSPLSPGLLILDEAHSVHDELCGLMVSQVSHASYSRVMGDPVPDFKDATGAGEWARTKCGPLSQTVEALKAQLSGNRQIHAQYKQAKQLLRDIRLLSMAHQDNWEMEQGVRSGPRGKESYTVCSPVWAAPHTEDWLFRNTPRVLLLSASLTRKSLDLLNILDQARFTVYHSDWPTQNQPVYFIPAAFVQYNMDLSAEMSLLSACVSICRARSDRKGIIHSVSYDRGRWLASELESKGIRVFTHEPGEVEQAIEGHRADPAPRVLISPVLTTGYNFPGAECEYQILPKIPTPDSRDKVVARRFKEDPHYKPHLIAQTIEQSVGRGRRSREDRCETFILDRHFDKLYRTHRDFFSPYFHSLFKVRSAFKVGEIEPLRKI